MESPATPDDEPNQPESTPAPEALPAGQAHGSEQQNRRRRRRGPRRPRPRREGPSPPSSSNPPSHAPGTPIEEAIARVRTIADNLEGVLADIEAVQELLEKAEVEKTADEQAIISLRQELDRIHRNSNFPRRPPRELVRKMAPPVSEASAPPET